MRLFLAITVLLAASVYADEMKSYTNYKLITVIVPNREMMDYVNRFEDIDPEFDIWQIGKVDDEIVATIMISPDRASNYIGLLRAKNMKVTIINENVQDLLDAQLRSISTPKNDADVLFKFARHNTINNWIDQIVDDNPEITKSYIAGSSHENLKLKVIIINATSADKKVIWIDCGIHAREWISPPACTYIINQLITGWKNNNSEIVSLLNKYEFHILPMVNPDGNEYSWASDRLWRKNRKPATGCIIAAVGTDLNRNFDYRWNTQGTSALCSGATYAGSGPESEPETKAVANAIRSIRSRIQALYTIHTYGDYWLLPWGHSTTEKPTNYDRLLRNAQVGANAIKAVYNETFSVGQSSVLLYTTSGSTSDWAAQIGIPFAYTLELRPKNGSPDASTFGFELPEKELQFTCPETWAGIKASILESELP